jgi:hypothetical protein
MTSCEHCGFPMSEEGHPGVCPLWQLHGDDGARLREALSTANARADTAEAAYSALREAVKSFAHVVHGGRPQSTASHRLASVLASTPATLAASYRERVERETIERCAKEVDARATSEQIMHDRHAAETEPNEYTRRRVDETRCTTGVLADVAARLRSLADAEKGGEQT